MRDEIRDAIETIEAAIGEWTTADWTHELGCEHGCDDCTDPDHAPDYCDGGHAEDCETCREAEISAQSADLSARAAIEALRDGDWRRADRELTEAVECEQQYGDAPVWGAVRSSVRAAITTVIDDQWQDAALRGLRIVRSESVAIVDDGADRWMTYCDDLAPAPSDSWSETERRASTLASGDDEDAAIPYQEVCDECPVVISSHGTCSGTRREQARLLKLAVREHLINREDALGWATSIAEASAA